MSRVGVERIGDLEGPYRALHLHHAQVAPRLAGIPAREEVDSWARRRAHYERWLAEPGAFALVAERAGNVAGFAFVTIGEGYDGWCSGRLGELRDLAVVPDERRRGIGSALLAAAKDVLAKDGIDHLRLNVIAANSEAVRLYERLGMTTVSLQMLDSTH